MYINEGPHISVIGDYLEPVDDGEKFLNASKKLKKPMVVLKSGKTAAWQKVAQSHTAALARNGLILEGILNPYGILRADSTEDFLIRQRYFFILAFLKENRC